MQQQTQIDLISVSYLSCLNHPIENISSRHFIWEFIWAQEKLSLKEKMHQSSFVIIIIGLLSISLGFTLHKIHENTGFHWPIFSCIRRKSSIFFLYGRIRVSENLYSGIFYAVLTSRHSLGSFRKIHEYLLKLWY